MSDPQGPGWWRAADGNWYPPTQVSPQLPGAGPPDKNPWRQFRAIPRWVQVSAGILGGLILLVVVAVAFGAGNKKGRVATVGTTLPPDSVASTTTPPTTEASTTVPPTTIAATTVPPAAVPTTTAVTTVALATLPPGTSARTTASTVPATTRPSVVAALCGAPANPFGYNFCHRGSMITAPAAGTCTYFACIPSFANGKGYMEQCNDGMYSMSGGVQGACSSHMGEKQPVWSGP